MNTQALTCGDVLLPLDLGREFIKAHAAGVEVTVGADGLAPFREALDLIRTVHLPFTRGRRLNLATPDETAREADLDYLKRSIAAVRPVAPALYVVHPTGLRRWEGVPAGEWDILVHMLRRLADETRPDRTGPLAIENNRTYWNGVPDHVPVEAADRSNVNRCFGETPAEWIALAEAVDRDDVRLCLDLSHATTSAHLHPNGPAREACLREFLTPRDRLTHVHWSDNYLHDARGRADSHRFVGRGDLPRWFHAAARRLPATFMFEVDPDAPAVLDMLAFVRTL
jgi:sugar phosphate isomerase/epimerase